MPKPFQILSLSGGGFLGLYTLTVLEALEREAGRPLAQCFDLLAGTSVGGILALGLAAEIPVSKIKAAFELNGTAMFSNRNAPSSTLGTLIDLARSALRPKYTSNALKSTIQSLVGPDTRVGELKHRVIVPTVNLTKGKPQVFKTPHHPRYRVDLEFKVVDVALAASAAPTFFPIAEVGDMLFADGGLYANSPDLLALHEAEHFLQISRENIALLSIGTTTAQYSMAHATGRSLGILGWLREERLLNVIISAQQQSTHYIMEHQLGSRYLRLDADRSKEQVLHLALDVATEAAQRTIRGMAQGTIQSSINNRVLASMLSHHATPALFHTTANQPRD